MTSGRRWIESRSERCTAAARARCSPIVARKTARPPFARERRATASRRPARRSTRAWLQGGTFRQDEERRATVEQSLQPGALSRSSRFTVAPATCGGYALRRASPPRRLALPPQLAARRRDLASLRAPHGHGHAVADERVHEAVDGRVARALHPGREVGVGVEGDGVDLRAQAVDQLCQRNRVGGRVVVAGEEHVLDGDLASVISGVAAQRGDQLLERVLFGDGHDLLAALAVGGGGGGGGGRGGGGG